LSKLAFTVRWHGVRLRVEIHRDEVTYSVHDGPDAALTVFHAGEPIEVVNGKPVTCPLRVRRPLLPRPTQPLGREPMSALGKTTTTPKRGK
jgi:hypothetical protein